MRYITVLIILIITVCQAYLVRHTDNKVKDKATSIGCSVVDKPRMDDQYVVCGIQRMSVDTFINTYK